MPEGANIGEVYLEGRLEFDDKSTPAFAAAVRRSMEASIRAARVKEVFANALSEGADEGMDSAARKATVGGRRIGENAGSAAKNSLERQLDSLNVRLPNLNLPVGEAMRDLDRVKSELREIRNNDATLKVYADTSAAEREIDRLQNSIRERFNQDTSRSFFASAFTPDPAVTQSLFETIRFGVSRALVGLFTSPAGILIGTAFMSMLSTAIVAGGTLIGAALTGAIVGGLGVGAIAGGIALVADHPKIQEAGNRIWQKLMGPDKEDAAEAVAKAQEKRDGILARIKKMDALGTGSTASVAPEKTAALKSAEYDLQIAQNDEERAKVQARIDKMHATGTAHTQGKSGGPSAGRASAEYDLSQANDELEAAKKNLADIEARGPGLLKKAAEPFIEPTIKAIDIFSATIDKVMPHIEGIFKTMAPYVEDFARAIGSVLERVLPALEKVLIAAAPVMDSIIAAIEALGPAIAMFFDKFSDPVVMKGAAQALTDISNALIGLLPPLGDFLATLAKNWPVLKEALDDLSAAWKEFSGGDIGSVENMIETAYVFIRALTFVFQYLAFVKGSWQALGGVAQQVGTAIKGWVEDLGASLVRAKDQAIGIWDNVKGWFSELGASLGRAKDQAIQIWNDLVQGVKDKVQDLKDKAGDLGAWFGEKFGAVKQAFEDFKNGAKNAFEDVKSAFQSVKDRFSEIWNNIQEGFRHAYNVMLKPAVEEWKSAFEGLKSVFSALWDRVQEVWQNIQDKIRNVKDWFMREVAPILQTALDAVKSAMQTLREKAEEAWQKIQDKIRVVKEWFDREVKTPLVNAIEDIKRGWQTFREKVDDVWTAVQRKIDEVKIWFLLNVVVPFIKAKQDLRNGFQSLREKVDEVFDAIRQKMRDIWNSILTEVWNPLVNFVTVTLPERFNEMKDKVLGIWDSVRSGLGEIWNNMLREGTEKINALIDLVNGVIRAVNSVPFIPDLPEIPKIGGPAPAAATTPAPRGLARGGPVHGGPPGTDTVPAIGPGGARYRLDNGEHIWTRKEVKMLGGHTAMYNLRAAVRSGAIGMAGGGGIGGPARVGADNANLLEEHRDHVHVAMSGPPMSFPLIIAAAAASGIPFKVNSTFRPGSRGSGGGLDHHSTGRAVDFGGHEQDRLAEYFEKLPGVIELIHRTGVKDYAIFGGGGGGAIVSWLLTAAGKAARGLIEKAVNALKGQLDVLLPGADKKIGPATVKGVFSGIGDGALKWFDEQISMLGQVTGGNPDPAVMKTAYETAKGMGANAKVLLALFEAGFVESGFRNLGHQGAANDHDSLGYLQQRPSSGWPNPMDVPTATRSFVSRAMGKQGGFSNAGALAQAVQISAFPEKYHQRRSSAIAALKQFDPGFDANGYAEGGRVGIHAVMDSGGWLEDDMTVTNKSGKPEPVFNHSQWDVLKANVTQGPSMPDEVILIVEGEPITARIKKNNAAGVQQLRRGRKP